MAIDWNSRQLSRRLACYPAQWTTPDTFSHLMQEMDEKLREHYDALSLRSAGSLDDGWMQFRVRGTTTGEQEARVPAQSCSLRSSALRFSEGFGLIVTDVSIPHAFYSEIIGGGWISIQIRTSGRTNHHFENRKQVWAGPCVSIYALPDGYPKGMSSEESQRIQAATILVRPEYLKERFPEIVPFIPFDLSGDRITAPAVVHYPMPAAVCDMVMALWADESDPFLRRLTFEARTLHLIAAVLAPQRGAVVGDGLSPRDIKSLQDARQYLARNFVEPPSLAELGRMVGLNRRKLTEGFKQAYGETVYQYCIKQRMARAQELLLRKRLSVTETALEVGYTNPGNFTKAFKQYYGILPRHLHTSLGT